MNECCTGDVYVEQGSSVIPPGQSVTFPLMSNLCTTCWQSPCVCCRCPCPAHPNQSTFKQSPHCCPVCEGRGTMPHGFYSRAEYASSTEPETCKACFGAGIIWA